MSNTFGKNIQVQIFGESHGPAIGCVVEGLPAGFHVDLEALQGFLDKRAPGKSPLTTQRKEADRPEFLAGLREDGTLTGAPLCAIIRNQDQHSGDYTKIQDCPRPGHADYTAFLRYHGHHDIRGGGMFSGRLTAPLCIAGGISLQILENQGVIINSIISEIGGIFKPDDKAVTEAIETARADGDSIGGVVECTATGFPAGLGNPRYDGLKNRLAQVIFGIPAVVGLEFGDGFNAVRHRGSENNDPFEIAPDGAIRTKTNHSGGILGGISTGMPIVLRVAFKPTPSIAQEQDTISLSRRENSKLKITGRHDPCIVPRALPVVTAATALVLLDFLSERPTNC